MPLTLDSLEMSEEKLRMAREEAQRMAYLKWEQAGRPEGDSLRFWQEAEREWIQFYYVPDRNPTSPPTCETESPQPEARTESMAGMCA